MSQQPAEAKQSAETVEQPPAHPRFAKPQRVAFVQSAWHRDVVAECRDAFLAEIEARHIARAQIDVFEVPGSFEIPLHVQLLAKTRRYTAIVAAGLVIDDEYIAETVIKALMDVQLRTEVPVFSAVVTPQQFNETAAHFEFFRKHFASQGRRGRGGLRQHAAQPGAAARSGRGGDRMRARHCSIVTSAAALWSARGWGGSPVHPAALVASR